MKLWRLLALMMLAAAMPASAQEKIVPQTGAQITYSYAPVVRKVTPAVVNIYTRSRVQVRETLSPFANDPFFQQFFGRGFGGRTREQLVASLGSGVLIKADGTIVTSHHVIKDGQEIRVVLADKREFDAKVIVKDPQVDLAFLKIDADQPLPFLDLRDSDTLEVGDLVLAIGNPFGVGQTVTSGIVSGLARAAAGVSDYSFFIQTDAAINPGNSGGALVDMDGKLIGINTAIYSQSGGSVGIGFAIPSNMVRSLMGGKVQDGRVVHPWLGFGVQPVTQEVAESLGMKLAEGALVTKLAPGSPAETAGLKPGDVITAMDGVKVATGQGLQYRLALTNVGDTAKLDIVRAGKAESISVPLSAPPEIPKRDERTLKGRHPLNGLTVANLSPALALEMGIEGVESGVIVIKGGSVAFGASINRGDLILEVNGTKVTSTAQLETLMKSNRREWQIAYQHGPNVLTLTVRM